MSAYSKYVNLTESMERRGRPHEELLGAFGLEFAFEDGILSSNPVHKDYEPMTPEDLHQYDAWARSLPSGASDPQDRAAVGEKEYMKSMKPILEVLNNPGYDLGRVGIAATNQNLEGVK